jgi:hypothetical protein
VEYTKDHRIEPEVMRCNFEACVVHNLFASWNCAVRRMEENDDAGSLIEEDYYTFFNIPRDVS